MITQQTNGNLLLNSNPNPSTTTTTNSTTTPVLSPSSNYNSSTSIIQQQQHSTTTSPSITQQQLQLNHLLTPTTLAAIPSPYHATYKDTRWLTLEVCREFQRNKCNRSENECKFAHPPAHVEVTNGKVIACYDSLKSKCTRKEPPCKYLHPPQHLKDQLLQNGKNNLVLKQVAIAMMQQQTLQQQAQVQVHQVQQQQQQQQTHLHAHPLHHASAAAHVNTQAILAAAAGQTQYSPYHSNHNANQALYNTIPGLSNGAIAAYQHVQMTSPNGQTTLVPIVTNGFHATGLQMQPGAIYADPSALLSHVTTASSTPNGLLPPHQRTDRLAICTDYRNGNCSKSPNECSFAHPPSHCPVENDVLVTVCVDFIKGKCSRETCKYFHPPEHLVQQLKKQKLANNAAAAAALSAINNNNTTTTALTATPTYTSFSHPHLYQLQHQQPNYQILQQPQQHYSHYRHNNYINASSTLTQQPSATYIVSAAATNGYQYNTFQQQQRHHHPHTYNRHYNSTTTTSALLSGIGNNANINNATTSSPNNITAAVPNSNNYINSQKTGLIQISATPTTSTTPTTTSTTTTTTTTTTAAAAVATAVANTNLLQNHDDSQLNGTYQIDSNGTYTFQPQYQILTPIYQQQQQHKNLNTSQTNTTTASTTNTNNNNNSTTSTSTTNITNSNSNTNGNNNSQNNLNEEATASSPATANATANLGDVIVTTSKKRSHDAIEIEYLPLQQHLYNAQLSSKRAALADSKTGLPVFQPYHTNATAHQLHALQLQQQQQQQQQITIPSQYATNLTAHQAASFPAHLQQFTMQYAPYPGATPTFSIPYTGNATSVPRL